jgi:beta-glucosidase
MARGVTPLDGIQIAVGNSATINYAMGCERWSNDQSGFPEAIDAATKSDVEVVVVGTWSRDQNELWQGLNATYVSQRFLCLRFGSTLSDYMLGLVNTWMSTA